MNDVLINVEQLCCKSGRRYLLNHVNWQVKKGEQWAVFGLNGCGKTTLLSIIAGFRKYTSGNVELFGEQITDDNILQIRQRIGWVSSSFFDSYYKNESALNIILAGKTGTLGLDYSIDVEDVKRAKKYLNQIGLGDKCNMPFYTLSKGERQNILLIRALLTKPEILILDEPCSGLDIVARERVLQTVKRIIDQKTTSVIYVTHYAEELMNEFTHVMLLKKGKIFAQGKSDACLQSSMMGDFLEMPVHVDRDAQCRLQIHFLHEVNKGGWMV